MDLLWNALAWCSENWISLVAGYLGIAIFKGFWVKETPAQERNSENAQKQPRAQQEAAAPPAGKNSPNFSLKVAGDTNNTHPLYQTHLTPKKSLWLAYVYFILGGSITGAHHVYLGHHAWAVLHGCSGGFLFMGSIADIFLIPVYVWRANREGACHPLAPRDSLGTVWAHLCIWFARGTLVFLVMIFVFPGIFEFVMDVDLSEGGNVLRKSPYKVLGVSKLAGAREVKMTYRALSKKYHPDLNPGCKECADRMREINDAWEKLKRRGSRSSTREERDEAETKREDNEETNEQDSAESEGKGSSDSKKTFASSWDVDWSYIDGTYIENWFNDFAQNLERKWETLINVGVRKSDVNGWNEWFEKQTSGPKKKKTTKASAGKKKDTPKSSGAKKDSPKSNAKHEETAKEEDVQEGEKPLDDSLAQIMRGFDADNDGKISIDELLLHAGDAAESDVFRDGFRSADADEDGYLNADELAYLLAQVSNEDPVESTMRGFDANQDGKISMEELLAQAGDDQEGGPSEMFAGWRDGFKEADADQDGYLTREELAHLLEHATKEDTQEPQVAESTMRGLDSDNDGKISLQELLQHADVGKESEQYPTSEDWKQSFNAADGDQDGYLTSAELASLLQEIGNQEAKNQHDSNAEVKEKHDPNPEIEKRATENNAEPITIEGLAYVLKHATKQEANTVIEESLSSVIQEFDSDENAEISLKEILPGDGAESHLSEMFGYWKDSFHEADTDNSGHLTAEEFAHFLKNLTEQQVDELLDPIGTTMARLDADKNEKISLYELLQHAGPDVKGWEDGFHDADANKDGHLVAEELIHLLNHVGTHGSKKNEDL